MFSTLWAVGVVAGGYRIVRQRQHEGEGGDAKDMTLNLKRRPAVVFSIFCVRSWIGSLNRPKTIQMDVSIVEGRSSRSHSLVIIMMMEYQQRGARCGWVWVAVKVKWLPNQAWNVKIFEGSCHLFPVISFATLQSTQPSRIGIMSHGVALSQSAEIDAAKWDRVWRGLIVLIQYLTFASFQSAVLYSPIEALIK